MLTLAIPPYASPVHPTELKLHSREDLDDDANDALIAGYLAAATELTETETGENDLSRITVIVVRKYELKLDGFPGGAIRVPRVPLVSVASIAYIDLNGDTQTVSSALYSVAADGVISLAYNCYWPTARTIRNAVTVTFIAGLATPFTAVASTNVCTAYGRTFTDGDRVRAVNSGGELPTALLPDTDYFVRDVSGSTFKLALTSGGTAIDITGAGFGTNFLTSEVWRFETLRAAIRLLAGNMYENREETYPGMIARLPVGAKALIAAAR